jgi:hypothetical protein
VVVVEVGVEVGVEVEVECWGVRESVSQSAADMDTGGVRSWSGKGVDSKGYG